MTKTFIVSGNPVGYYAQGCRSIWQMSPTQRKRAEKYREYQFAVRTLAAVAGVFPLIATIEKPLFISTIAYFENHRHPDPGNVQKGIVDALFYNVQGGDKYTGGFFPPPQYDASSPRVEVIIEDWTQ